MVRCWQQARPPWARQASPGSRNLFRACGLHMEELSLTFPKVQEEKLYFTTYFFHFNFSGPWGSDPLFHVMSLLGYNLQAKIIVMLQYYAKNFQSTCVSAQPLHILYIINPPQHPYNLVLFPVYRWGNWPKVVFISSRQKNHMGVFLWRLIATSYKTQSHK